MAIVSNVKGTIHMNSFQRIGRLEYKGWGFALRLDDINPKASLSLALMKPKSGINIYTPQVIATKSF
jgi:hypothetical protein